MSISNKRNEKIFARRITATPGTSSTLTLGNDSSQQSTLVYTTPSVQSDGALFLNTDGITEWDNSVMQQTSDIQQLSDRMALAEAQMTVIENSSVTIQQQYDGLLTGFRNNLNHTEQTWYVTSGDVASYQAAFPTLGISSNFSSLTPTRRGLVTMNVRDFVGNRIEIFRVYQGGTCIAETQSWYTDSAHTVHFAAIPGNVYTFTTIHAGSIGARPQWDVVSVFFLSTAD
jgi:hypothetical protein